MERDIEDYLGWLRDKRGKAARRHKPSLPTAACCAGLQ